MNSPLLALPLQVKIEARQVFWKAWIDWLANASDDQINALEERVLAPLAHHVRSVHQVMADALSDREIAALVPADLLASLRNAGWPPAQDLALKVLTEPVALHLLAVA